MYNEFRYRKNNDHITKDLITPVICNFDTVYNYKGYDYNINFDINYVQREHKIDKILVNGDCQPKEELLSKLTITCESKEVILDFIKNGKKIIEEEYKKYRKSTKETIRIFYYKSEYWVLLSKSPKRPIETIYLKKDIKEKLLKNVEKFFDNETRKSYLNYGIPYKSVCMIYGPPGTGKTSIIKSIASNLDCDLFVLPIVKDMLDNDLVGAFGYINEQDSKERIIVIEDVDTLFDNRKEGDNNNGITLQGFLNCLDGFTCIEGTMLFLTANKPEVLDSAFVRSCRIDFKIKLDYADKYQTEKMFHKFLPKQKDKFNDFYKLINHKQYTTASLQEFLFYNRDCEDIIELIDQLYDIIDYNDPKNFEILKEENKNFYS